MKMPIPFSSFIASMAHRKEALLKSWLWNWVVVPFTITRMLWLLIAWYAHYYLPDPSFIKFTERGWFLSPHFLIDIWSRWDARWYLSIVTQGYATKPDLTKYVNNIAFFPLYPYLVKIVGFFFPNAQSSQSIYLLFGILLSNLFFLIAAVLLYKLIINWISDETLARRTLVLLFVFPTSFYFSCFYTESLYLMLSLGCFITALKHKWFLASLLGGLLSLTRPPGILIIIPILWFYMKSCNWKIRNIRFDIAWLLFIPVMFGLHFLYLYQITGSLFAPIIAQQAFGRGNYLMENVNELINLQSLQPKQLDALLWLLFFVVTIIGMWQLPSKIYGIYALMQLIIPISTGSFFSAARFLVVIFPTFLILAKLLHRRSFRLIVITAFFTLQVLYFLGWVNYYWIA